MTHYGIRVHRFLADPITLLHRCWALSSPRIRWNGTAARRRSALVLSSPPASSSFSSSLALCPSYLSASFWAVSYLAPTQQSRQRTPLKVKTVTLPKRLTLTHIVCPVALRGVLTSYINMCFVIGQLIANGVISGTSTLDNHWAYSGPFAAQWFWCAVILAIWPFAPESPWYLVRKERFEEAEHSLRRLASSRVDVKPTLAMIIETDRLEQELEAGVTYIDCFKKINIRRTEIAMGVYSIQVISGIYLVGYATYFFEQAGLPTR